MRLSVKIESTIIDVFNSKNWNIRCCGSEKCALSHGVGVSQGPVHDCTLELLNPPVNQNLHVLLYHAVVGKVDCPLRGDIRKNWNDTEKISMAPAQG